LEQGRHEGISIVHVCFDRAIHGSLMRHRRSHMGALAEHAAGQLSGLQAQLLPLCQWFIGSGCCNHDTHNGLKWGLFQAFGDATLLSNVYIGIESVRNSYLQLAQALPAWIVGAVSFTEAPTDGDILRQLWASLGVDPDVTEELVELRVIYRSGNLQVDAAFQDSIDLVDRLSACCLAVWRFVKFSDSRWITVGRSARTMVAAHLMGLQSVVEAVLRDPRQLKYHLNGYTKLGQSEREFLAQAALSPYPADSLLAELLEDDRVAIRADGVAASDGRRDGVHVLLAH
jgi:hypothetical protein